MPGLRGWTARLHLWHWQRAQWPSHAAMGVQQPQLQKMVPFASRLPLPRLRQAEAQLRPLPFCLWQRQHS